MCFATSWLSRKNATQSWLTIGSLIAAIVSCTAGWNRSAPILILWCVVPNRRAIRSE